MMMSHHIPPLNNNNNNNKKLSPRELEITALVAQDKTYKEIALELGIKIGTVKAIAGMARLKINVRGKVGLAVWYAENYAN